VSTLVLRRCGTLCCASVAPGQLLFITHWSYSKVTSKYKRGVDLDAAAVQEPLPDPLKNGRRTRKRKRIAEFVPTLPLTLVRILAHLPGHAWTVYLALHWRSKLESSRTVSLTTCHVKKFGLTRHHKWRGLSCLERAGLVRIKRQCGRNPVVTLLSLAEDPSYGCSK
jgi:hypothetical protein